MKNEVIARWEFGYVALDIINASGLYVARYWFQGEIVYTGFASGKVKNHWVMFFVEMSPNVFYVPDLYTHPKFPCRFGDYSKALRFINLLEDERRNV